jgi:hypothetical protein
LEETRKQIDTDIIDFISNNPLCSYYEMVESLLYSPETINKTLTKLKKEKKIGTVDFIERKAKGWKVTK